MKPRNRIVPGVEQCLTILLERLDAAGDERKTLQRCLRKGTVKSALEVALDIEPLLREANQALHAASLLWREDRSDEVKPGAFLHRWLLVAE